MRVSTFSMYSRSSAAQRVQDCTIRSLARHSIDTRSAAVAARSWDALATICRWVVPGRQTHLGGLSALVGSRHFTLPDAVGMLFLYVRLFCWERVKGRGWL